MSFPKTSALLMVACLLGLGLAVVQAQTSTATLDASFTGYIDASDGTRAELSQGRPCKGNWVEFVPKDTRSGFTHYWYLNGAKNPYGDNQSTLRFSSVE